MESIIARALEYTLKYWLKSFSRDQFKLQGRTVQLSNLDINGDAIHCSIGLPPALNVVTAKVGKLEIKLPYLSYVQVEPIVVEIDRLDLVLKESSDFEAMPTPDVSQSATSAAKGSDYGFADKAVNQLCGHFEAYRDVPKITELRDKFKNIKQILKSHVFSDFSSLGTGKETEETNLLQHLSDACLVVDALEPSVREELVKNFCHRELTSYQQIFEGAELAKLDKTERRYAWIKRRLRTNEEIWKIFPSSWHVAYLLCIQFCKLRRSQLMEILDNLKEKPDVGTLLLGTSPHLPPPGDGRRD